MRRAFAVARLTAAVVCVLALISRLVWSLGISGPIVANFFSYFTMQSAIAAGVLWTVGGVIALRHPVDPPWLVSARAVVTSYQIVSGVVFAILTIGSSLRGLPMVVPVSSDVLHYWLTLYAIADWVFAPGRLRPSWRPLRVILVYPFAWIAYTLVRGSSVGWFPYFFLDPALSTPTETLGYLGFAAVLLFAAFSALTLVGRRVRPLGAAGADESVDPELLTPASVQKTLSRPRTVGDSRAPRS